VVWRWFIRLTGGQSYRARQRLRVASVWRRACPQQFRGCGLRHCGAVWRGAGGNGVGALPAGRPRSGMRGDVLPRGIVTGMVVISGSREARFGDEARQGRKTPLGKRRTLRHPPELNPSEYGGCSVWVSVELVTSRFLRVAGYYVRT
jgi:hypothetical protein